MGAVLPKSLRKTRSLLATARIASSSAVLAATMVAVFFAGTPCAETSGNAVALVQLVPAFLRWWGAPALLAIFPALVGSAFLFGRGYCSFLCPLGALEDLALFLSRKARRARLQFRSPQVGLRVASLGATLLLWLFGSTLLLALLDPYSIVYRGLSSAETLARGGLTPPGPPPTGAIPADPAGPGSFGRSAIGTASALLSILLLATIVIVAARKGRLYCTTLCPVGALLSPPGRCSLLRLRLLPERCTSCGACEQICPARCIDTLHKHLYSGSCVLCFSCLDACRHGALRYGPPGAGP